MMADKVKTIKLSDSAFRRGANDVLTLKPLREAVGAAFSGKPKSASGSDKSPRHGSSVMAAPKRA